MIDELDSVLHQPVRTRIVAYLMKRPFGLVPAADIYRRDVFNAHGDIALPDTTRSALDTTR